MKKVFLTIILVVNFTMIFYSQCKTQTYILLAESVFNKQIREFDFSKETLFLTIDTINSSDFFADRTYVEYTDSKKLIKHFYETIGQIKVEGDFFNYYELINNPVYPSPLHQSYLINTATNTYKVDIWNNHNNIFKIDGLTIVKLKVKYERTPY